MTARHILVLVALAGLSTHWPVRAEQSYRWFTVPVTVRKLPPSAAVPVSITADFNRWLRELQIAGAIDERSIRLDQLHKGETNDVPCQFVCDVQPRATKRHLLPNTSSNVSYVAEYSAGDSPGRASTVGELSWLAQSSANGSAEYLLSFGVPNTGRLVQVPFPPQNLRGFDEAGRATPIRWFPGMRITPQWPFEGRVHLFEQQQLITSYFTGPTWLDLTNSPTIRRPFFYPVNGPDSIPLTEVGKPHDPTGSHAHHYSMWIAHHDVNNHSFWGEKAGIIAHDQFETMEDGAVFCRLVQKTRWIDQGVSLLRERRRLTVFKEIDHYRLLDIDLEFTPEGSEPVTFGKTSFGFLAIRVAQSMTPFDGGGEIRNSEDGLNEAGVHYQSARWLDQSGPVTPTRWGGIAIFDHPQNLHHPTGWHCRNDGWAGAAFNLKSSYRLGPGETLRLRYRVLLHRGNAVDGQVEKRYQEYSSEPEIVFGRPQAGPNS